jgi:hypothetical protein
VTGREIAGIGVGYAALSLAARGWHRTWGATAEEIARTMPGDELISTPSFQTTRAIDVNVAPGAVWPWLVQMGQGRGGLYTYEWIENLLGAKIHNLAYIDPELQHLAVGDQIRLTPDVYLDRIPGQFYRVVEIQPQRALVMLEELPSGGLTSWSFILQPSGGSTRMIVRARASSAESFLQWLSRTVELLLLEPGYFVMERGMLRGIKKRAERGRNPAA